MWKNKKEVILVFVLVFILATIFIKINPFYFEDSPDVLNHNYILFQDKNGDPYHKVSEINGWLFLEALIMESLNYSNNQILQEELDRFGNNGFYGWWPEEYMQYGKRYFFFRPKIKLSYDADDTTWGQKYKNNLIKSKILNEFLSETQLPIDYKIVCGEINCENELIVRVWNDKLWHDDIDIITISNVITNLNVSDEFHKKVFMENKKLINHIIENYNYNLFHKYYEPNVTGTFLLLFYNQQNEPYLSYEAKKILVNDLKNQLDDLTYRPILARWGGGEDWFYGYSILTINEKIPKLMHNYSIEYLLD